MNHFENKVVIVTGGASGIGQAICKELGHRGATVIVADVNAEGAEHVTTSITETHGQAYATL